MNLIINADDYGLTLGINKSIEACIEAGVVNGISLIVNGDPTAYKHAVAYLKAHPEVRVMVHLNLAEGRCLAKPSEVDLLIDGEGAFRHSFVSLWIFYLRSEPATRRRLREQVLAEYAAQVAHAVQAGAVDPLALNLDGHGHYHMIPFVFDAVMRLTERYSVRYVRVTREPWVWPSLELGCLRNYMGPNIFKHFLLRVLARLAGAKANSQGILVADYWYGALFSGDMSVNTLKRWLRRIPARARGAAMVEAVFHPGAADSSESARWDPTGEHYKFYFSPRRFRESEELRSLAMLELLDEN